VIHYPADVYMYTRTCLGERIVLIEDERIFHFIRLGKIEILEDWKIFARMVIVKHPSSFVSSNSISGID